MNDFAAAGNQLKLSKGVVVELPYPIQTVLSFGNYVAVLLEIPTGTKFNENVFGISIEGKILWQIQEKPHVYDISSYTSISKLGDNLELCNWDGLDLVVDPKTGNIISESWSK